MNPKVTVHWLEQRVVPPHEAALGLITEGAHVDFSPGAGQRLRAFSEAVENHSREARDPKNCDVVQFNARRRTHHYKGLLPKLHRAQAVALIAAVILHRRRQ